MFGIGMPQLLLIMALALIFIAPKKTPDIARPLGQGMLELRNASNDLKRSIDIDAQVISPEQQGKVHAHQNSAARNEAKEVDAAEAEEAQIEPVSDATQTEPGATHPSARAADEAVTPAAQADADAKGQKRAANEHKDRDKSRSEVEADDGRK